eukprot:jgi/Hompol1/4750/HPOL_003845-RA
MKVYFCGSIRGGIQDAGIYLQLIEHLQAAGHQVLTEHVGKPGETSKLEEKMSDQGIWETDMAWLRESDIVIAECTVTSMGVGYELGIAESLKKPVLCLFRHADPVGGRKSFSAMITGNVHFVTEVYQTVEGGKQRIDAFLASLEHK